MKCINAWRTAATNSGWLHSASLRVRACLCVGETSSGSHILIGFKVIYGAACMLMFKTKPLRAFECTPHIMHFPVCPLLIYANTATELCVMSHSNEVCVNMFVCVCVCAPVEAECGGRCRGELPVRVADNYLVKPRRMGLVILESQLTSTLTSCITCVVLSRFTYTLAAFYFRISGCLSRGLHRVCDV